MAVKITIPNVGVLEAENAASEDTLKQILEAIKKSESTKRKEEQKANEKLKKQQEEQLKAGEDYEKGLKDMTETGKKSVTEAKKGSVEKAAFSKKLSTGLLNASMEVGSALAGLTDVALASATAFLTTYDSMRKDPIGAGKDLLNAEITGLQVGVHGAASAIDAFAMAFGPEVGIPVMVVTGLITAVTDLFAKAAKAANEVMAKEFKKSADALKSYTEMGASFAGGMAEMRTSANNAGLSIETLANAAKKGANDLTETGLSHGEAVKKMADGMGKLATLNGKSGAKLRDEMVALGYSYEEQGEVMAQYMAQQRSAGKDLRNLAPEELARGAREYAQNLKVISDITGQDAKKLMEKAKTESMQAGVFSEVMKKGGPEAVKKLQNQLATMPEGLKKAYLEKLSLGKVVDAASNVYLNANEKAAQQLDNMSNDLYNAGVSAADATKKTGEYSEQTGKYALDHADNMSAIGKASIAGVGGIAKDTADLSNKMTMDALKRQQGATDASVDAAQKQADLAGQAGSAEQGLATLTSTTENLSAEMEKLTGSHLGEYAELAANQMKAAAETLQNIVKASQGTTKEKLTRTGEKALEYSALGAAAGTFIPGVGTAVGGVVGGLYGAYKGWTGMAEGGWASGDKTGFLEKLHGTELVIPTSGGKIDTNSKGFGELVKAMTGGTNIDMGNSLANTFSSMTGVFSGFTDMINEGSKSNDEMMKKMDSLISSMNSHMEITKSSTESKQGSMSIKEMIDNMNEFMAKQLDVQQDMVGHAKDSKDIMQKLLNVSM